MLLDGPDKIVGAGRGIAAIGSKVGRYGPLVKSDQQNQHPADSLTQYLKDGFQRSAPFEFSFKSFNDLTDPVVNFSIGKGNIRPVNKQDDEVFIVILKPFVKGGLLFAPGFAGSSFDQVSLNRALELLFPHGNGKLNGWIRFAKPVFQKYHTEGVNKEPRSLAQQGFEPPFQTKALTLAERFIHGLFGRFLADFPDELVECHGHRRKFRRRDLEVNPQAGIFRRLRGILPESADKGFVLNELGEVFKQ